MDVDYYLDTSVFGGYYDAPFQEPTRRFWSGLESGLWRAFVSTITLDEIGRAPESVRKLLEVLPPECYSVLSLSDEAKDLADRYIAESVLGQSSEADALHVVVATLSDAKAIISWNFKHLVNLRRIEGFNGVNLLMGYRTIDIRTPSEVIES